MQDQDNKKAEQKVSLEMRLSPINLANKVKLAESNHVSRDPSLENNLNASTAVLESRFLLSPQR